MEIFTYFMLGIKVVYVAIRWVVGPWLNKVLEPLFGEIKEDEEVIY